MKKRFNLVTGLSDHTIDNATSIAGIALGASIIEKHVTLNRNGGGPDDSFSLEPQELEYLCTGAKNAWKAIGKVNYGRKSSELGNVKFRRSLYVVEDIKAGEVISNYHVRSIRPGYGLAPKYLSSVIGKKVNKDLNRGEALKLEYIVK
jgi:N-acetylneuraminate synthase